ncbi:hypothetical protein scyTo_0001329 [Scyliorhinus torazame]|uniref:Uncharacterized protein n=1 Tax=Scyliorhinus torazame TaxID=75743 RepID=A0A401PC00_SCYTO|nr:hypothetical protein [Scyliorhinus torazame]
MQLDWGRRRSVWKWSEMDPSVINATGVQRDQGREQDSETAKERRGHVEGEVLGKQESSKIRGDRAKGVEERDSLMGEEQEQEVKEDVEEEAEGGETGQRGVPVA